MYGYVRYGRDEMKVKHLKLYSKYYSLLCTELGNKVGLTYRFLTSYDVTAFMILFDSLAGDDKVEYKISCPITRSRNNTVKVSPAAVDFGLLICLFWAMQKVDDNCSDEKSKKWKVFHSIIHKNSRFQSIVDNSCAAKWDDLLKKYYEAENMKSSTFDELANLIGEAYGEVFNDFAVANGLEDKAQYLYEVGFNVGKYIPCKSI